MRHQLPVTKGRKQDALIRSDQGVLNARLMLGNDAEGYRLVGDVNTMLLRCGS